MTARRLDGKIESAKLLRQLKTRVRDFGRPMTLSIILVGRRFDSSLYVKLKIAAAEKVGIRTELHTLPSDVKQAKLEKLIQSLNRRSGVHGILLQLPLPSRLNADRAVQLISAAKDADGFHPGNGIVENPAISAVLHLLRTSAPLKEQHALIIGKPSIFTRRLQELMRLLYSGVTIAAGQKGLQSAGQVDAVVTVMGHGAQLHAKHIKRGAVVVDVGIRKIGKKTSGDAAADVWSKASAVSPVPGGIGPLTVAYVLWNTYALARSRGTR